jgi:hypothetical protein
MIMDTVEQLNGTYFYAGRSNLTSSELLFMIFCEKVVEQYGLGVADFSAVAAIVSGRNNLSTRGKIGGNTTKGTSYASKASRAVFKKAKFPYGIELPTWLGGYTPWTARKIYVRNIGTFVGRTVPLLGVIILAADISQIVYCTIRDYNFIVSEADKIW